MTAWDDLWVVLTELRDTGALMSYPDPQLDRDDAPPYRIELAPWATDAAASLHDAFGVDVELVVGVLSYPDRQPIFTRPTTSPPPVPDEATVELDGPGGVPSGHVLHTGLRVHNLSATVLAIRTNGQLTAVVLDPATGHVVGGYSGAQRLPLVVFQVPPGEHTTIPLMVGTASFVPELGYSVPEGAWEVAAD